MSSGDVSLNSNSVEPPNRAVSEISWGRPRTLSSFRDGPADDAVLVGDGDRDRGQHAKRFNDGDIEVERVSHVDGRQRDVAEHSKPIEPNAIAIGDGLPVRQPWPGLNLLEDDSFLDVPEAA